MRALLTSCGLFNDEIDSHFEELLGHRRDLRFAYLPTAGWPIESSASFKHLEKLRGLCGFLDIFEPCMLTQQQWLARLESADVIFMGGGDAGYLVNQLHKSGVARALPALLKERLYVGISAGSVAAGPDIGWLYDTYERTPGPDDVTLGFGVADVVVLPHLSAERSAEFAAFERVAKSLAYPAFSLSDDTAVKVVDGVISIVGGGQWQRVNSDDGAVPRA